MTPTQTRRTQRSGRPSREESEQLAAQILDAACRLFIEQGFGATTMEQIVAACGIGRDTLYRRFATKEELFAAVSRRSLERTLQWFETTMQQAPDAPLDRVRHLARWFLEANLEPDLLALKREAFIEAMRARPIFGEDPFTPRLIEAIAASHACGALQAPDPAFTAQQLIAAVVLGPSNEALMGHMPLQEAQAREQWFEKAWALFLSGARCGA